MRICNMLWFAIILFLHSCVNPFSQENVKFIDTNGEQRISENKFSNVYNHEIEPVDKYNILESDNTITNATYNVSLFIPHNWKRFHGQAEHTILKVANKKFGSQVSLIRMKEKYNNFKESDIDIPLSEYVAKISDSGINLQNAKEIETTCLGYRAKRIDANYLLYVGNLSIVENYISISFVKDGALYTLTATFPQMLSEKVMSDIDKVFNSIHFNQ